MEETMSTVEQYDYRKYDRIWRRVAPELNPYPEARAADEREAAGPSCPLDGTGADRLAACMDAAASLRRLCLGDPRCVPPHARRTLQCLAGELERQGRKLAALYYLLTGDCRHPAVPAAAVTAWCPLLRQLYQGVSRAAERYGAAAEDTKDPCIRRTLEGMAEESRCQAAAVLQLLEKSTLA